MVAVVGVRMALGHHPLNGPHDYLDRLVNDLTFVGILVLSIRGL